MTLDDRPGNSVETRHGVSLLARLARRLGLAPISAEVAEHLAELQATVAALAQVQAENQPALSALRETVEKTEKQLARLGKEKFKANLLAETQQQNVKTILEELREAEADRERELAQLRERMARVQAEGRLEIIKSVLPALDGLDEALASGERLLKSSSTGRAHPTPHRPRLTFRQRLSAALWLLFAPPEAEPHPTLPAEIQPREAVVSWLQGLGLVQERLLDILAAEGVYPIDAEDESFDPHQHVAVETVPATGGLAPGTIVRELRRGYRLDEGTVLRYAEVVVARDEKTGPHA